MKISLAARSVALCLALSFAGHALPQALPPAPQAPSTIAEGDAYEPKFIWGILINIAFKVGMSLFTSWATSKLTTQLSSYAVDKMVANGGTASILPLSSLVKFAGLFSKGAGAPENAVAGDPGQPVKVENGKENYQGVHVALVGFDRSGAALGFRPVTDGFRTGERFKLRLLPTFDGIMVINNINPQGVDRQIYPPQADKVVAMKSGVEILVPLGRDQYFEFTGGGGDEKLVITLRDPLAFGEAISKAPVFRKNENNGSNFMQEVGPGRYPLISQALSLRHD